MIYLTPLPKPQLLHYSVTVLTVLIRRLYDIFVVNSQIMCVCVLSCSVVFDYLPPYGL